MIAFLSNIRTPAKELGLPKQILNTSLIALFGALLGLFSKILDCTAVNELPYLFQVIDLTNFLGRMAIWILFAVAISIYSNTPFRASINTLAFFIGMLTSYYLYTVFVAGFFPKSYIMIWVIFTLASPFLAYFCWFAKGKGVYSLVISSIIIGVLFNQAFSFGFFYFFTSYLLEVIVWIVAVIFLYQSPKQLLQMLGLSLVVAISWNFISPFGFLFFS